MHPGEAASSAPELIRPTTTLRDEWLESRQDWGRGAHQDGSGLGSADDLDSPEGFLDWVDRLNAQSDISRPVDQGRVHATYWWIFKAGRIVGSIDLRHDLNDFLTNVGGNIGYSVRPSFRQQGLATWALGAVLPRARTLGLERVLLTCEEGNAASRLTIERNGGVLEDVRDNTGYGPKRRYWITL